ncbi:MAG: cobalamin-dependent protein [Nitrospirae bacterium]|nr:cobalamin-dependent protein [Nitrospirota bacterium]
MAKVLLLSPPYVDLYGDLSKAAGRYFPLGLGYIASYLRKYGSHDVSMYEPEAQGLSYSAIVSVIKQTQPDVIGITCATPNFSRAIELAKLCKGHSPAKVVMGGVHVSAIPEFVIQTYSDFIDCVVIGEGEHSMLELVNAYQNNASLAGVNGIIYKAGNAVIRNGIRPYIEDMDTIPFPARDLIPQRLFVPNMHNVRYRSCMTILTSRGCPFNCSFCAARIVSGKRYRMHSAQYVLEEMQMLKRDYNARQLIITDDTFTINHSRLEEICRGMIDKRLNLKWFCFSQANTVNREVLTLMKRAGCYSIGFGLESSDAEILKRMGKPIAPAKAKETVTIANSLGIKTQAFYIIGSPGETKEQMEDTLRFSREVNATLAFYNMLVPFPGTKEFDYFFASIPLEEIDWKKFVAVGEDCVIKNSTVSAQEIESMIAKANFLYYTDIRRLLSVLSHIRTFYELANYFQGGIALIKQIGKWIKK